MDSSKISMTKVGPRTILIPKTALTWENNAALEAVYKQCLEQNRNQIVLDCKSVPLFDSAALELLLRMNNELKSSGGALVLVGLNAVCHDILMATRLDHDLHVFKNLQEVVLA